MLKDSNQPEVCVIEKDAKAFQKAKAQNKKADR